MDIYDKSLIPEDVLLYTKFENLLWECTEESLLKAREMIDHFNIKIIYKLIYTIAVNRPFSYKLLGDFISTLERTKMKFPSFYTFSNYLYSRNLLTTDNFNANSQFDPNDILTKEEYENPLNESKNPIAYYAFLNDVQKVTELQVLNAVDLNTSFFEIQEIPFALIDLTAYCGSLDVMKYLILNNVSLTPDTASYAIKGGNEAMLEFLVEQGLRFDYQLETAIMAHQNKIACWLLDNYDNEEIDLPSCIGYFNTDILLYFIYNAKRSFKEKDYYKKKFILLAKEHDNNILLDYFTSQYQ